MRQLLSPAGKAPVSSRFGSPCSSDHGMTGPAYVSTYLCRLDFDEFETRGPETTGVDAGTCDRSYLDLAGSGSDLQIGTDKLCGILKGQHGEAMAPYSTVTGCVRNGNLQREL